MQKFIQHTQISILATIMFIPVFILFCVLEANFSTSTSLNIMISDSLGVLAIGICLIVKEKETKHSS